MQLTDKDLLRFQGLIDGRWQDAGSGGKHEVVDPATQNAIGTVPDMGEAETRVAIEAAEQCGAVEECGAAERRGDRGAAREGALRLRVETRTYHASSYQ